MNTRNQKAFTMIELVFVIVVIGILSAIALPRFGETADNAYLTKAQSTVATVRSALSTERQKRILRGDTTTAIVDLGLDSTGTVGSNAFDHFSTDADGNYTEVFPYPVAACNGNQRACWVRNSATTYWYRFPDAADATDGVAKFVLQNNRFDCDSSDTADCQKITQ